MNVPGLQSVHEVSADFVAPAKFQRQIDFEIFPNIDTDSKYL